MPRFGRFVFGFVNTFLIITVIISGVNALGTWVFAFLRFGPGLNSVASEMIGAHALVALTAFAGLNLVAHIYAHMVANYRRSARPRGSGDE
jgi:hypothetical protein